MPARVRPSSSAAPATMAGAAMFSPAAPPRRGAAYVPPRRPAGRGVGARVAALGAPASPAAAAAREGWRGEVEPLETAGPSALLVDDFFGTGLKRALDS